MPGEIIPIVPSMSTSGQEDIMTIDFEQVGKFTNVKSAEHRQKCLHNGSVNGIL